MRGGAVRSEALQIEPPRETLGLVLPFVHSGLIRPFEVRHALALGTELSTAAKFREHVFRGM
jgi:hypothetical protein